MLELFSEFRWTDVLDVALVALFIWAAFSWLRRARSRLALPGVVFLAMIYVAARQFGLQLTAWILQGLSAVVVIALVVIFQDDLRRFFEQIAVWGLRRRNEPLPVDVVDILTESISQQARTRTGALYVIPGRQSLDPHLEGGREIDAKLSQPLLLSLFDPRTPGHDGAVVIDGWRLSQFGAHLPLSVNHAEVGVGGTRHAAALGLAERTDALCIVVSEERGTISVARDGRLHQLTSVEELGQEIRFFLDKETEMAQQRQSKHGLSKHGLFGRWIEGALAVVLALAAWTVLVPASASVEVERLAQINMPNLPPGYRLEGIDPPEVLVVLRGPRLQLPGPSETLDISIEPDPLLITQGRRTFPIFPSQVKVAPRVQVISVRPDKVFLSLESLGDR